MTIKSWFQSLVEILDKRSAKKAIQEYKKRNILQIMFDEGLNLCFVNGNGYIDFVRFVSSDGNTEDDNKFFYDEVCKEYDRLFGAHRQGFMNCTPVLVWDVQ